MVQVGISVTIGLRPPIAFTTEPDVIVVPDTDDVFVVHDLDIDLFFGMGGGGVHGRVVSDPASFSSNRVQMEHLLHCPYLSDCVSLHQSKLGLILLIIVSAFFVVER